jgi:hypothetical protein
MLLTTLTNSQLKMNHIHHHQPSPDWIIDFLSTAHANDQQQPWQHHLSLAQCALSSNPLQIYSV